MRSPVKAPLLARIRPMSISYPDAGVENRNDGEVAATPYHFGTMLGRTTYLDDIRLKINRALANKYDVDYKADWQKPGNKPVEKAFQQSKYGLELLIRFSEPD